MANRWTIFRIMCQRNCQCTAKRISVDGVVDVVAHWPEYDVWRTAVWPLKSLCLMFRLICMSHVNYAIRHCRQFYCLVNEIHTSIDTHTHTYNHTKRPIRTTLNIRDAQSIEGLVLGCGHTHNHLSISDFLVWFGSFDISDHCLNNIMGNIPIMSLLVSS